MPVTMKMGELMSSEEFFQFCQMNDTLEFERDSHGNIILMSPTGSLTGEFNSSLLIELGIWNKEFQLGKVFDSSTGFTLPNGAVRSPDVSWVPNAKWDNLSEAEQEQFAPVCPDFVIEVRSKSEDLKYLLDKMDEYMANGALLGWLIDRFESRVYIYNAAGRHIYHSLDVNLDGESVLPGFKLNPGSLIRQS